MKGLEKYSYEFKKQLKHLLQEGFTLTQISRDFKISYMFLKKEVDKGLTELEASQKRYIKYNPKKALLYDIKQKFGEEALDVLGVIDNE